MRLSSKIRFGKVQKQFQQRKNARKSTQFIWLKLPPKVDEDGLYNPSVAILVFLN